MADPVRTLLLEIEEQCEHTPGCELAKALGGEVRLGKLRTLFPSVVSPGYTAFADRYDGGKLARPPSAARASSNASLSAESGQGTSEGSSEEGVYLHLLGFEEAQHILRDAAHPQDWKGLWPVARRGLRIFALDFEASPDGEPPVVEVGDRSVDRVGSSFLRFLSACLGEIALGEGAESLALARELCHRDPGLAEHWVHLIDFLEDAGRKSEIDAVLVEALRCASPPGPALVIQVGLRALDKGETGRALAGIAGKTIVLTGALAPALFKESDATFNIGFALACAQTLPPGVYLAMNGTVFDPFRVRKNRERNAFEAVDTPEAKA